VALKSGSEIT